MLTKLYCAMIKTDSFVYNQLQSPKYRLIQHSKVTVNVYKHPTTTFEIGFSEIYIVTGGSFKITRLYIFVFFPFLQTSSLILKNYKILRNKTKIKTFDQKATNVSRCQNYSRNEFCKKKKSSKSALSTVQNIPSFDTKYCEDGKSFPCK